MLLYSAKFFTRALVQQMFSIPFFCSMSKFFLLSRQWTKYQPFDVYCFSPIYQGHVSSHLVAKQLHETETVNSFQQVRKLRLREIREVTILNVIQVVGNQFSSGVLSPIPCCLAQALAHSRWVETSFWRNERPATYQSVQFILLVL